MKKSYRCTWKRIDIIIGVLVWLACAMVAVTCLILCRDLLQMWPVAAQVTIYTFVFLAFVLSVLIPLSDVCIGRSK